MPATASETDLRALAEMVSRSRDDVSPDGLPPSLLLDLMGQIRCDALSFTGFDTGREVAWFGQNFPAGIWPDRRLSGSPCPMRTGSTTGTARAAVIPTGAGISAASLRSRTSTQPGSGTAPACSPTITGRWVMSTICPWRCPSGPGRSVRLFLFRGAGPDFSEHDRALLTLLRPHLQQAYLDAEQRRDGTPQLTPRHWELLRLVAAGHTNAQIARRLSLSEGTVRKHLENIYARLQVSSRTAAVTRAFPSRAAAANQASGPRPDPLVPAGLRRCAGLGRPAVRAPLGVPAVPADIRAARPAVGHHLRGRQPRSAQPARLSWPDAPPVVAPAVAAGPPAVAAAAPRVVADPAALAYSPATGSRWYHPGHGLRDGPRALRAPAPWSLSQ